MIHYSLVNTTSHTIDEEAIARGLAAAAAATKLAENKFVSIEIVSKQESQDANKALRGHDEPTDCISIPTIEQESGEQIITLQNDGGLTFGIREDKNNPPSWPVLGQLIICYEVVAANADHARQPVSRELEWVIEHGILHLLGFHHDEGAGSRKQ